MKSENRRNILFRYGSITVLILLLTVRIVYKLVDNTVLSADKWNARAEEILSKIDTIMPVRGDILAADGSVLATNMRVYTPCIDFRADGFRENLYRENIPALADSLVKYFPVRTRRGWIDYLSKPLEKERGKRTRAFPVLRDVSYAEVQLVKTFPFLREKKSKPVYMSRTALTVCGPTATWPAAASATWAWRTPSTCPSANTASNARSTACSRAPRATPRRCR